MDHFEIRFEDVSSTEKETFNFSCNCKFRQSVTLCGIFGTVARWGLTIPLSAKVSAVDLDGMWMWTILSQLNEYIHMMKRAHRWTKRGSQDWKITFRVFGMPFYIHLQHVFFVFWGGLKSHTPSYEAGVVQIPVLFSLGIQWKVLHFSREQSG